MTTEKTPPSPLQAIANLIRQDAEARAEAAERARDEIGFQLEAARAWAMTMQRERDEAVIVAHGLWLRRRFEDDHPVVVELTRRLRRLQGREGSMDMTQKLSPHFTLAELCRSREAERRGIDNTPPDHVVANLRALCRNVLEPIRSIVDGRTIIVSSGYRSPALNEAVGGNPTGQHPSGEAVDFEVPGLDNLELAKLIRTSSVPFDQLILEFHTIGDPSSGWLHISHSVSRAQRGQVLTASKVNGKTVYSTGLAGDDA